jgi:hypothetical protein
MRERRPHLLMMLPPLCLLLEEAYMAHVWAAAGVRR